MRVTSWKRKINVEISLQILSLSSGTPSIHWSNFIKHGLKNNNDSTTPTRGEVARHLKLLNSQRGKFQISTKTTQNWTFPFHISCYIANYRNPNKVHSFSSESWNNLLSYIVQKRNSKPHLRGTLILRIMKRLYLFPTELYHPTFHVIKENYKNIIRSRVPQLKVGTIWW